MLSLLEKFEAVEIKNETRVSEEDLAFCKHQEESYRVAVDAWKEAQKLLRKVMDEYGTKKPSNFEDTNHNPVYMTEVDDMDFTKKRITALKGEFVGRICSYFKKKYNVSIDTQAIKKKYKSNITHQDIIDEIFVQLDGLDFGEKSVQELKDRVRQQLTGNYGKIEVKNKKLIIPSIISIDHFTKKWDKSNKLSYSCHEKVYALFKGLSHFEYDKTETAYMFNHLSNLWTSQKDDAVFKTHELNLEKVVSIKPFQGGKVEINFVKRELAIKFAAEYLDHA